MPALHMDRPNPGSSRGRVLLLSLLCSIAASVQAQDIVAPPTPASTSDAADSGKTSPVQPPHVITSTCTQPVYPSEALAANRTGTVLLSIQVSAQGKSMQTDVAQSSGDPQLDEAAATGMSHCEFQPATQDGVPVAATTTLRYTFKIDNLTAEDVANQKKMTAVIALQGLEQKINVLTDRCALQAGAAGKAAGRARENWHKTNDALLKKAENLENGVFDAYRRKSQDPKLAEQQIANTRRAIDSMTERAAGVELTNLESVDDAEEAANCSSFDDSTLNGKYDLQKVLPDFVAEVEADTAPADKPAKKK